MNPPPSVVTRLDYCQYLLSTQINYTLTHFADHSTKFSQDAINRSLAGEQITPRLVWENVQSQVVVSPNGYLVFDDTMVDKNFSHQIERVRWQDSGKAHGLIKGIGVVTCVDVNPATDPFWIMDDRLSAPDGDGKTKWAHVHELLQKVVYQKQLAFRTGLMDPWDATKDMMLSIEALQKLYYCPLKDNRHVDASGAAPPYPRVDGLRWSAPELTHGKPIKSKGFPKAHKVKLFRVVLTPQRTDYIVTNAGTQNETTATQEGCGWRWKIEPFHRETKQLTGLEQCQCRKARIVRNHIGCAILVWVRLKQVAHETHQTIYQVKHGLLDEYLRQQLKSPSIQMVLA